MTEVQRDAIHARMVERGKAYKALDATGDTRGKLMMYQEWYFDKSFQLVMGRRLERSFRDAYEFQDKRDKYMAKLVKQRGSKEAKVGERGSFKNNLLAAWHRGKGALYLVGILVFTQQALSNRFWYNPPGTMDIFTAPTPNAAQIEAVRKNVEEQAAIQRELDILAGTNVPVPTPSLTVELVIPEPPPPEFPKISEILQPRTLLIGGLAGISAILFALLRFAKRGPATVDIPTTRRVKKPPTAEPVAEEASFTPTQAQLDGISADEARGSPENNSQAP